MRVNFVDAEQVIRLFGDVDNSLGEIGMPALSSKAGHGGIEGRLRVRLVRVRLLAAIQRAAFLSRWHVAGILYRSAGSQKHILHEVRSGFDELSSTKRGLKGDPSGWVAALITVRILACGIES